MTKGRTSLNTKSNKRLCFSDWSVTLNRVELEHSFAIATFYCFCIGTVCRVSPECLAMFEPSGGLSDAFLFALCVAGFLGVFGFVSRWLCSRLLCNNW